MMYDVATGKFEFNKALAKFTGGPKRVQKVISEVTPYTPCFTPLYDSSSKGRLKVPLLYEVGVDCKHEIQYFKQNPDANLVKMIVGFELDEKALFKHNDIFE